MNRQLYQMGGMGMESLSPMQPAMQPAMESAMYNPLESNYYSGTPMMMASGGIANLVKREKYGIGSKLKKFVRNIIPNEISEIAVKAAPFVAPFNPALAGAMAGIGGFDQTGRIGSSLKNAALVYGAGQLARGIGGAGFQGNPFTGVDFSGGFTSGIQSLFTSPMGNLPFGSFSTPTTTPTQNLIQTSPGYTGGADALTYDPTTGQQLGRTAEELQKGQLLQSAKELETGMGRSQAELIKTYGTQPGTEPGYIDLIKKAGSFENVPLSERFNAVKDLSSKALTDLFTKPVPGEPGKTQLDKTAVFATISGASSYYEALQLAKKAGIPESEFSEADYQRLKVDPEKAKFASLKAENFGIRKAEGGRIGYGIGDLVRSSGVAQPVEGGSISGGGFGMGLISKLIQQNPQMFKAQMTSSRRDFIDTNENGIDDREEAAGGGLMDGGVLSIKLTPAQQMAMGGRIGYQVGGNIDSYALTQRPDDLGLPGFDDDNLSQNREPTLEEAMARGVIFYDPIAGFQVNPLTGGRMGTGMDPNFIARRAMQAEQDAAARTKPYVSSNQMYMPGVTRSTVISSPYQTMKQDLLMRQGAVQTGGTPRSASEGSSGINPLFAINRLIQAEQDAAARVKPKMAMGGEIPVRQNPGGITELDLRAKGGYIPVGIKEKADDVPAMLSKNEFVFTADAVRGAGGGNINKGAQKMYKLMKSLEKKVKKMKKVA
jgi:hypothetical protein